MSAANKFIRNFSFANLFVLCFGVCVTLSFLYTTRCAKSKFQDPKASKVGVICTTSWSFVGALAAAIALVSEFFFIIRNQDQVRKSASGGFWITSSILAVFGIFVILIVSLAIRQCQVGRPRGPKRRTLTTLQN